MTAFRLAVICESNLNP